MKYLIAQEWASTKGNHAGVKHMCDLLVDCFPGKYSLFFRDVDKVITSSKPVLNRILYLYNRFYQKYVIPKQYIKLCKPFINKLKPGDEVFLLEYLTPMASQKALAMVLKKRFPFVRVYALSHLTPSYMKTLFPNYKNEILSWGRYPDKMLTLGHTLSDFFIEIGIPKQKVSTGFYFVDTEYYGVDKVMVNPRIRIISMGMLQRDFQLLCDIVAACPEVDWVICAGNKKIDHFFKCAPNLKTLGYVDEVVLREEMRAADISLNVLEDTVGSNVITTSLASGLGLVTSDVGSIRDYCDEGCAIFCKNKAEDFILAIRSLVEDRDRVLKMKENAIQRSKRLGVKNIDIWFDSLTE